MATALRGEINSWSQSFLWKPLRPQGRVTYLRVGDPSSFSIRWASAARPGLSRRIRAGRADPHSGKPAAASRRLAPAPETTVDSSQAQQIPLRSGETARASGIAENRGFGPHSPYAAGDWRGGARSPPSGHSGPPGGGRPRRSAPLSLALLSTPRPTRRTLKRPHGALLSDASRSPHGGR